MIYNPTFWYISKRNKNICSHKKCVHKCWYRKLQRITQMVGLLLLSAAQGITAVGNGLERWQHLSTEPPAWKGVPWLQRQPESSEPESRGNNKCYLLGTSEQGKRAKEKCVFHSSCICRVSCGCGASKEEAHATHRMRLCNESWV